MVRPVTLIQSPFLRHTLSSHELPSVPPYPYVYQGCLFETVLLAQADLHSIFSCLSLPKYCNLPPCLACSVYFLDMLGIELRASHLVGKCSTTKLYPLVLILFLKGVLIPYET